ncbi:hypothetical protein CEXT_555551, partial [Caerostris extrusa]
MASKETSCDEDTLEKLADLSVSDGSNEHHVNCKKPSTEHKKSVTQEKE